MPIPYFNSYLNTCIYIVHNSIRKYVISKLLIVFRSSKVINQNYFLIVKNKVNVALYFSILIPLSALNLENYNFYF